MLGTVAIVIYNDNESNCKYKSSEDEFVVNVDLIIGSRPILQMDPFDLSFTSVVVKQTLLENKIYTAI